MATETTWRARVRAWRGSGLSAREFVQGKDFAEATLRWWAWRLRGGGAAASRAGTANTATPRLLRVVPRVQSARPDGGDEARPDGTVTVQVGRARVSVPAGVDRATLREVLAALDAIAREGGR